MTCFPGLSTGMDYRHPIEGRATYRRGDSHDRVSRASSLRLMDPKVVQGAVSQIVEGARVLPQCSSNGIDITSPKGPFQHVVRSTHRSRRCSCTLGATPLIQPAETTLTGHARERSIGLQRRACGGGRVCSERGLDVSGETPLPQLLGGHPGDFDWSAPDPSDKVECASIFPLLLGRNLFERVAYCSAPVHIRRVTTTA